ncbi:ALBINO3-like protein 1, chloroplastic [Apostasia shenzhenica]|uniref:ALBINO3-like protein 1, chloroplastic n=1 Tax=Apostasia shenzhenica TaxID=1088818 RepID=A0A2I0BBQ7_9ASPA|nr:ALBINO3-like protein 1, chloroplastic [Apostasia shenzhenica]
MLQDGHPPLGWSDTLAYLVLPVLLVLSQYISAQVMQPPQVNHPSQKSSQVVTKLLPLMIGYFALSVPSGLSLYWLTNNILSTAQQIWFQKLGGAKSPVQQSGDDTTKGDTSNMQKFFSDLRRSAVVEKEKSKSSVGSKSDSAGLRRGERFKQIKEEEARRRKQREERRMELEKASAVNIENKKTEAEFTEKMDSEKSENCERSLYLSMQINGNAKRTSTNVEDGNSQNDVERTSHEPDGSSGFQTSVSDTTVNRNQDSERDEN